MSASKPQSCPTYELTAREYAFWLWSMFFSGVVVGGFAGAWIW